MRGMAPVGALQKCVGAVTLQDWHMVSSLQINRTSPIPILERYGGFDAAQRTISQPVVQCLY
jgi:hypothetical protein